ncbi:MAG: hypothetical protein HZB23_10645 [Deltaproteobacteria bacterium]|nr:hypothetical protein [Deltaproteobacteria bacterium]
MNQNINQILEAGLRGEEVFLNGVVVPGELDALFRITSLLLSSDQELDFEIEHDAKGDELFGHLRALLAVKGFLRKPKSGRWMIRITDYRVLVENNETGRGT